MQTSNGARSPGTFSGVVLRVESVENLLGSTFFAAASAFGRFPGVGKEDTTGLCSFPPLWRFPSTARGQCVQVPVENLKNFE